MVTPYSIEADVRLEAGKITSIVDLTATDVTRKIEAVDRLIDDATGKGTIGWLGTEFDFPRVKEISTQLAASLCRLRFDPEKAKQQWDSAIIFLNILVGEGAIPGEGGGGLIGDIDIVVDKGEFMTFPKNPNAKWSRGRYDTSGITEITHDPDIIYEQSY